MRWEKTFHAKTYQQKNVLLFFTIVALTLFGSTRPMFSKIFACLKKPSSDQYILTKLTEIPTDCLREILQFYAGCNDFKSFCPLRLVCHEFEKTIRERSLNVTIHSGNTDIINFFTFFGKIEELQICDCDCSDLLINDLLTKERESLKNLYKLDVRECDKFTGEVLQYLTNLHTLNVITNHSTTNLFNESVLKNLICLDSLIINVKPNDSFTGSVLKNLRNLCFLAISHSNQFTGKGLEYLQNLNTLYVDDCKEFTGEGLEKVKSLRTLLLIRCDKFTDETLEKLNNIGYVSITNCKKLSEHPSAIAKLRDNGCTVVFRVNPSKN